MIKCALAGFGRLGRVHFQDLVKLEKIRDDLEFVAICDIDPDKLAGKSTARSNVDSNTADFDISRFRKYTDFDEMLAKEELDFVVLALPTDLHSPYAIKALNAGVNVFSEKPMAHTSEAAKAMVDTAKATGKKLMIGHCLHFWRAYLYLKDITENKTFGETNSAHFWRGGYQDHVNHGSYQDWIIDKNRGGGGLFDQHVHDAELVHWLYGMPEAVFTQGMAIHPKSADDVMLTTYVYPGKVITARDDTATAGLPFQFGYEVGFEKATVRLDCDSLLIYQGENEPYSPDISGYSKYPSAYESEMDYFIEAIKNDTPIEHSTPEQGLATIYLVEAEAKSSATTQLVAPVKE